MAQDWQQIDDLFSEALALPPQERHDFLAGRCAHDADLRAHVERLLGDHDRAGPDFLECPAALGGLRGLPPVDGTDQLLGQTIGTYSIKQSIALGGMGAVYLAEQESPRRDVALKIMTAGFWSRSAHRRFEFETEILGRLHHPNIAQVFEAGSHRLETGATVPFFAMEYIPGARRITDYCDQHRLDLRARLRLFCSVCEAAHHGHQKGVIHRDLKPANILVDEAGHAKVIDFGVAHSTESDVAATTMHTDAGQLIGTLAYMSPEQAGGAGASPVNSADIDIRTDLYSLGVVLFELLTGRMPYDVSNQTLQAAARVICEQEPARPSQLAEIAGVSPARLRGDLDTIILKCLEKDRARRYVSAAALAEDVERHLRREPISARPPTRWTRTVRWVARHPIATTTCLCLLIAVTTIMSTKAAVWYYDRLPYTIVRYRAGEIVQEQRNCDEARLVSRIGSPLHTWGGSSLSIEFAKTIEAGNRSERNDAGMLAVIGYTRIETTHLRGALCAYETEGDLKTPKWHRRVKDKDVPAGWRKNRNLLGAQFGFTGGLIDDIFPESLFPKYPGDEIVAIFGADTSHRIVRIYSQSGELLYQVAHDGSGASYWLSGPRLLLYAGDCHALNFDEFGNALSKDDVPMVVFALQPKPDCLNTDHVLATTAGQGPLQPRWYKFVAVEDKPLLKRVRHGLELSAPTGMDSTQFARLSVIMEDDCSLYWMIDEFGNEVPNTRIIGQQYKHARLSGTPPLPDPDLLRLVDQLPALSPAVRKKLQNDEARLGQ